MLHRPIQAALIYNSMLSQSHVICLESQSKQGTVNVRNSAQGAYEIKQKASYFVSELAVILVGFDCGAASNCNLDIAMTHP